MNGRVPRLQFNQLFCFWGHRHHTPSQLRLFSFPSFSFMWLFFVVVGELKMMTTILSRLTETETLTEGWTQQINCLVFNLCLSSFFALELLTHIILECSPGVKLQGFIGLVWRCWNISPARASYHHGIVHVSESCSGTIMIRQPSEIDNVIDIQQHGSSSQISFPFFLCFLWSRVEGFGGLFSCNLCRTHLLG